MQNIIVGTAGHVDHGKTCLIKALSGFDTDRLKEEKRGGLQLTWDLPICPMMPDFTSGSLMCRAMRNS